MASVSRDPNGRMRIQFFGLDGKRRTLRLGKCSVKDAHVVRSRIEQLVSAQILGVTADVDTLRWVANLGKTVRDRMARCGLITGAPVTKRVKRITLGEYLEDYIQKRRKAVKPATVLVWQIAKDSMLKTLPRTIALAEVNAGHAQDWLDAMRADGLQPTTQYKRLQFAKQFFSHAVASKVLPTNPWQSIRLARPKVASNVEVPLETIRNLMKHLDPQWQAIVGLARYGGLRCPSEVLSIRWEQIDWLSNKMIIPSPKTEHLAGKDFRDCPLFADLRIILEPQKKSAGYVIEKDEMRALADRPTGWANANLRKELLTRLDRAKIKPWPRLFHSMRASRQTELEREFGLAAACAWLGNTASIAKEHYLLVTSDAWQKAAQNPTH